MAALSAAQVVGWLQTRPGDLITAAEAAAALGVSEADVGFALRMLAAGFAGCTGLTRRQGGWVYYPDDDGGTTP